MKLFYVFWKINGKFSLMNYYSDENKAKNLLNNIISKFGEGKIVEKEITSELDKLCLVCFTSNWIPYFKTRNYTVQSNGDKLYHYECGDCHQSLTHVLVKNKSLESFIGA